MGFYEIAKEIDKLLKGSVTAKKFDKLLILIKEDISCQNYFFKEVKDTKWFLPIKKDGYFNPDKNPHPIPVDSEGSFTIPEWNVLPYLERVSQLTKVPSNEKYIDELLTIIKEVSNYRDPRGQHVENYRTWYYFIKILQNLPKEKITEEAINLIPIWLGSRFDTSLPGTFVS